MSKLGLFFKSIIHRTFFIRILLIIIIFATIPIMIIYSLTYYRIKQSFEEEIIKYNLNYLEKTITSVETIIKQVQDSSERFFYNKVVLDYLSDEENKKYKNFNAELSEGDLVLLPQYLYSKHFFYANFQSIMYSCEFIDSIFIYEDNLKTIYNSGGDTYSFDKYYDTAWYEMFKKVDDGKYIDKKTILFREYNSMKFMSIVYKHRNAYFVVNINIQKLFDKNIEKMFYNDKDGFCIINSNNDILVGSSNMESILTDDEIKGVFEKDPELDNKNVINIKSKKGGDFVAIYLTSPYFKWKFSNFILLSDFNKPFTGLIRMITIVFVIIILIFIFLSLFASKSLYKPIIELIEEMVNKGQGKKTKNRYRDIGLIKTNIEQLHEKNSKLYQKLSITTDFYKQKFLYDLINGFLESKQGVDEKLSYFECNFSVENYYVAAFEIIRNINMDEKHNENEISENEFNLIKNHMICILNDVIAKENKGFVVEGDNDNIILAYNKVENEIQEFYQMVCAIKDSIMENLDISISIGIGEFARDIYNLNEAYKTAVEANRYKISFGRNAVICFNDIKINSNKINYAIQNKIENMLNCICTSNEENAVDALKDIIANISANKLSTHYNEVFDIFINILNNICTQINETGRDPKEILDINASNNLYTQLIFKFTLQDMEAFLSMLITKAYGFFANKTNAVESKSRVITDVCKYVEDNYHKDLSLDILADIVKLNPIYLSRIFKEQMDINLNSFIERVRMEKAKCLLADTNFKINEISLNVGFNSCNYFSKVFKKFTGVTPKNYRDSLFRKM